MGQKNIPVQDQPRVIYKDDEKVDDPQKLEVRDKILGKGNAIVYAGKYGNMDVAVKRMELARVKKENEYLQHKELDHENIVELLARRKDDNFL